MTATMKVSPRRANCRGRGSTMKELNVPNYNSPEWFWRILTKQDDGCWIHPNRLNTYGYAEIKVDGVRWKAHRYSLHLCGVVIPQGMVVDHLCRNRACVNHDHLEVVTQQENLRRGEGPTGKNFRATHCPQGHEYNDKNTIRSQEGWRKCRTCVSNRDKVREQRPDRKAKKAERGRRRYQRLKAEGKR